jgi:hypothetical protein
MRSEEVICMYVQETESIDIDHLLIMRRQNEVDNVLIGFCPEQCIYACMSTNDLLVLFMLPRQSIFRLRQMLSGRPLLGRFGEAILAGKGN